MRYLTNADRATIIVALEHYQQLLEANDGMPPRLFEQLARVESGHLPAVPQGLGQLVLLIEDIRVDREHSAFKPTPDLAEAWERYQQNFVITPDELRRIDEQRAEYYESLAQEGID